MSDIFREVDEALQQEKILKIWKEYGPTLIAAIAILIASTAIFTAYKSWNAHRNAQETAKVIQALDSGNPTDQLIKIIGHTRGGQNAIAVLTAASHQIEEGNYAAAADLYKQAADSGKTPRDMRDLSRILYVRAALAGDTEASPEELLDTLKPALKNHKGPWVWHARIEAATLVANTQQDYLAALDYLEPFKEAEGVTQTLQKRADSLLHLYALKMRETPAATEEGTQ